MFHCSEPRDAHVRYGWKEDLRLIQLIDRFWLNAVRPLLGQEVDIWTFFALRFDCPHPANDGIHQSDCLVSRTKFNVVPRAPSRGLQL